MLWVLSRVVELRLMASGYVRMSLKMSVPFHIRHNTLAASDELIAGAQVLGYPRQGQLQFTVHRTVS